MRNFRLYWLLVLFAGCAGSQHVEIKGAIKLNDVLKTIVLTSNYTEITVVELKNNNCLIRVSGEVKDIQNLVLSCKTKRMNKRSVYIVQIGGRERHIVHFYPDGTYGRGLSAWKAYLPRTRDPIKLTVDIKKSKSVKAEEILIAHHQQKKSGKLDEISRWNRDKEEKAVEAVLDKNLKRMQMRCGSNAITKVDWSSFSDEMMKKYSIASYCSHIFDGLYNLCKYEAAKEFSKQLKTITCRYDKGPPVVTLNDKTLSFKTNWQTPNLSVKMRSWLRELRFDDKQTLGEKVAFDSADLCVAKNSKKMILLEHVFVKQKGIVHRISYGDGKSFYRTRELKAFSSNNFHDPRFVHSEKTNRFWRGYNLEHIHNIETKHEDKKCVLRCGDRKTELRLADKNEKATVLKKSIFKPALKVRQPYALARNRKGIYFFVDRGADNRKDFRVYVGRRGNLKRQKMKDVVSDSEGEIFSTRKGDLRLIVGKDHALWIAKGKKDTLQQIPVHKNLNLIYNKLGVYLGQDYGTPCDIF